MVQYFDFNKAISAYGAGQKQKGAVDDRRSFREFAQGLRDGNYNAAAASIAQTGDVNGSLRVRDIPYSDRANELGNEFTRVRIDDVGIDNQRADRTFAANQAQRQFANARAEAEFRMQQAKASSTLGKLKMDLDRGFLTPEQYEAAVTKATTPSKGVTVNTGVPSYNAGQAKAAGFADRMLNSEKVILDTYESGLSLGQNALEMLPQGLGNLLQSEDRQRLEQAKRDWINANLRQESGAVIGESEFRNADLQYFPQPGDSELVLQQKARNRELAAAGMTRAAGPGFQIEQQQNAGPQPGMIEDGYQFKGGDPADPNNWQQVQ